MSNNSELTLTPDGLREIAAIEGDATTPVAESPGFKEHRLGDRLGPDVVDEIVRRYEAGESARQLAQEHGVAPSALLRLMRERNMIVRKRVVEWAETKELAQLYEAGATMVELEEQFGLSHGAVHRALRRAGVTMRPAGRGASTSLL
ncbi:MAG: helix-turn-helix domain-containing protein [Leucobacter sp.]